MPYGSVPEVTRVIGQEAERDQVRDAARRCCRCRSDRSTATRTRPSETSRSEVLRRRTQHGAGSSPRRRPRRPRAQDVEEAVVSKPVVGSRWRTALCRPAVALNGTSVPRSASIAAASCVRRRESRRAGPPQRTFSARPAGTSERRSSACISTYSTRRRTGRSVQLGELGPRRGSRRRAAPRPTTIRRRCGGRRRASEVPERARAVAPRPNGSRSGVQARWRRTTSGPTNAPVGTCHVQVAGGARHRVGHRAVPGREEAGVVDERRRRAVGSCRRSPPAQVQA